jgi:hypothetical protein
MVRRLSIGYIAGLMLSALTLLGCGKSDSGPPPGATVDVTPPSVEIDSPMDSPASATKSAPDAGAPDAKQGDKKP